MINPGSELRQGSLLAILRGLYLVLGIEPASLMQDKHYISVLPLVYMLYILVIDRNFEFCAISLITFNGF